jgi:hypothetical protein
VRPPLALVCLLAAAALPGCGADRAELPADALAKDAPRQVRRFPAAGIEITLPRVTPAVTRKAPGVFRAPLGEAYLAAFAYRRAEQLPRNSAELQAARRRLVAEVHRRDKRFRLIRSRATRVAGARAVELVGDQRIAHGDFRTRSVHVFKGSAEYVIDMLAPVTRYRSVDATFFSPALASLKLTGSVKRGG